MTLKDAKKPASDFNQRSTRLADFAAALTEEHPDLSAAMEALSTSAVHTNKPKL